MQSSVYVSRRSPIFQPSVPSYSLKTKPDSALPRAEQGTAHRPPFPTPQGPQQCLRTQEFENHSTCPRLRSAFPERQPSGKAECSLLSLHFTSPERHIGGIQTSQPRGRNAG